MQTVLLKIINRVFWAGIILSVPLNVLAKSDNDFPYHINKAVEKEKTYDYAFEDIWETALILIKEMEEIRLKDLREEKLNSVKAQIKSDKSSGLITFYLTHKGKKGFFSKEESLFYYQVLLLNPLGKQRTRVYFHEINFFSYDHYVFSGKQDARYVDITYSANDILDKILIRLKGKDVESR